MTVDPLRGEFMEFRLAALGASPAFSLADELGSAVVTNGDFAHANAISWRLKFTAEASGARITATDLSGVQIGTYSRLVSTSFADSSIGPAFAIGLLYTTAAGYDLRVECVRSNGVRERIMDLQFRNGAPTDHDEEPFAVDFR
ncbi:MAG TPA: hypothetical protein DEH78_25400 [Solibacterales bacterium]|nr:hypothetical protein [Bryobacterales bacterium]